MTSLSHQEQENKGKSVHPATSHLQRSNSAVFSESLAKSQTFSFSKAVTAMAILAPMCSLIIQCPFCVRAVCWFTKGRETGLKRRDGLVLKREIFNRVLWLLQKQLLLFVHTQNSCFFWASGGRDSREVTERGRNIANRHSYTFHSQNTFISPGSVGGVNVA